jgi:DNA-binding CsgD family transcriptional regulator/tetratricopeptide (TPR) repeat protein
MPARGNTRNRYGCTAPIVKCRRVMQARRLHVHSALSARPESALAEARSYGVAGDYERCLATLDEIGVLTGRSASEALLLRAFVLCRLHRFSEVLAILDPEDPVFTTVEDKYGARLRLAAVLVRSGEVDRGLAILQDLSATARALGLGPEIQAEIAYEQAHGFFMRRDLPRVIHFARVAEAERADSVSARGTMLRAAATVSQGDYPAALQIFHEALDACYRSRDLDQHLVANIVMQISTLELILRSSTVIGSLRTQRRFEAIDFTKHPTLRVLGMATMATEAWHHALDGNRAAAFRFGRRAAELAANDYWHVWTAAQRAGIAKAFGNVDAAREHAAEAVQRAFTLEWGSAVGDETLALLSLAEVLADTDPPVATEIFFRYERLAVTYDPSQFYYDDPRLVAYAAYVRGLIHRINGRLPEARDEFQNAYRRYREIGHLWRSALTLIELDASRVPDEPHSEFYLETAALIIREHFSRSFLVRRLGRWLRAYDDSIVANLSPSKREVLRHLLEGCSPKDIARRKCLAEGTVRNHICEIEAAFEVHSIQELMAACYRRGLGVASWSDEFDPTATFVPAALAALPGRRA